MWNMRAIGVFVIAASVASMACGKSVAKQAAGPATPGAPSIPAKAVNADVPLPEVPDGASKAAVKKTLLSEGDAAAKMRPYLAATAPRKAFDKRDWAGCAAGFAKLLADQARHPQRRQAAILMHLCQEHAGHPRAAARGYDALAKNAPLLGDHLSLRAAETWLAAGDPDRALKALDRISNGYARKRRATEVRGRAWRQKGDHAKALKAYTTAAGSGRATASLLLETAEAAAGAGKPKQEARWLRAISVQHPGTSAAKQAEKRLEDLPGEHARLSAKELLQRASNARKRHKRKLAIATADEAMKAAKKASRTWCDAGVVKARALETWWPRRKEAAALYDRLAKTCPKTAWSAKLRYRAAKRQMNSASGRRAIELFAEVAAVAPQSTLVDDTMRYRARILRSMGRQAAADKMLAKILTLGGDMVEYAGWDLLWRDVQARMWKRCISTAKRATAATRGESKIYNVGRIRYWQGVCEQRSGKRKAAIASYKSVNNQTPWTWYGMLAQRRLGDLGIKHTPKTGSGAGSPDLLAANRQLLDNDHLLAGIELLRLGMATSAAAEMAAVKWDKRKPDQQMFRAMLHGAVGEHTRATAIASRDHSFDRRPAVDGNRQRWELAYPRPGGFRDAVTREAKRYRVDEAFIWAIMRSESRFNPRATSPVLATGLLQLMPGTGKAVARRIGHKGPITRASLTQPALNIRLGTAYMRRLLDITGGQYPLIASGYNAGPHNTKKWLKRWRRAALDEFVERIPFRENRRYVKSVVTSWIRYRMLYTGSAIPALDLRIAAAAGAGRKSKASRRR